MPLNLSDAIRERLETEFERHLSSYLELLGNPSAEPSADRVTDLQTRRRLLNELAVGLRVVAADGNLRNKAALLAWEGGGGGFSGGGASGGW